MSTPKVVLTIGGIPYEGFTSVEVNRSVSDMAGVCTATLTDRRANGWPSFAAWDVEPGHPVTVHYGPLLVMTGLVDQINPAYTATTHGIQITTRSATKDAVDSSAELPDGEMQDVKLEDGAKKLLEPFGKRLSVEADTGAPFRRFGVMPGETVQETIERYARQRGVLITDDEEGEARLKQVKNTAPTFAMIEGINIIAGSATISEHKKHSEYKTKGQDTGTDEKNGRDVSEVEATVRDSSVKRHRPLILPDEIAADDVTARQRADWEASYRAGESVNANITAPGWGPTPGSLYRPGDICFLHAPLLKVQRALAVQSVKHAETGGDTGSTTSVLTLVPTEALNPGAAPGGDAAGESASQWTQTKPAGRAA